MPSTALAPRARALLDQHSSFGPALVNHCTRLSAFTLALARHEGIDADPDLVRAAAWLHDIGLCVTDPAHSNYLERGVAFAAPHLDRWGVTGETREIFEQIMLYNHALGAVPGLHPLAQLVRKAVQVEHSFGLIHHGLPWATRSQIRAATDRLDFTRVVLRFTVQTLRIGGPPQLLRVFWPRGLPLIASPLQIPAAPPTSICAPNTARAAS